MIFYPTFSPTRGARCLLCALFLLTSVAAAYSQTAFNREWETVFGNPESDQWARTVMDGNGDIYTTGNTKVSDAETAILTTRQDCDGNTIWEKLLTHPGGTAKSYGIALSVDGSGNVYVAGTGLLASSGNYDLLVAKYDSQSNLSWQYSFDGGSDDIGTGLVVDATGNVFVSAASKGASTGFDYLLLRLNSSGSLQWSKVQDFSQLDDFPVGLELTGSESEVVVSGISASGTTVWDFATVKRNASGGTLTGSNTIDAEGVVLDEPAGFAKDGQGNFYLSGTVTVAPEKTVIKTLKLDASLNLLWEQEFAGEGKSNKARTVSVDNAGNAYVGGHTSDQNGDVHFILIKYNPSGNEAWTRTRQPRQGEHSEILCSAVDGEGNVVTAAEAMRSGTSFSLTMKFAPDGSKLWEHSGNSGTERRETPKDIFPVDGCVTVTEVLTENAEQESRRYRNIKFCESACDFGAAEVVTDKKGDPLYMANQVIVKFNRMVVNTGFVDDTDKQFGTVEEIITDSLLIAQMDSILGAGGSLRSGWEMRKIFKRLTSQVTSTTTRRGRTVPVPDFWTTFLLCLPKDSHVSADIPGTAQQLAGLERIIYAEPNHVYTLDNCPATDERYDVWQANLHPTTAANNTWLNGHINMEDAWCFEQGEEFVRVGVFDDGIDWEHEDFGDGTQTGSKIKGGYNYVNGEDFMNMAPNGSMSHHGTPIGGIIGAFRNNAATASGKSVAGIAGGDVDGTGNTGVSLYTMRIDFMTTLAVDAFLEGNIGNTDPNNGFTEGLHIFSNSWGSPSFNETFSRQAYFAYRNEVLIGASRGNDGVDIQRFPCTFEDEWIMCVGSSDTEGDYKKAGVGGNPNDANDMNYASNFGKGVDFIAPGTSALIRTTKAFDANDPTYEEFPYRWFTGTSAAVPHIVGVASLMLSHVNSPSPSAENLAPEDVENIIQLTTVDSDVPPSSPNDEYDDFQGWGLLDASAAMALIRKPKYRIIHVPEEGGTVSKTSTLVNSSVQVSIEEPVGSLQPGNYIAEQHEFTLTYDHQSLMTGYDLLNTWNRNSASEGYDAAVTDDLTAARKTCQTVSIDENQGVLKTHNYRITHKVEPGGGQTPVTPTWVVTEECPYSLHVDDPLVNDLKEITSDVVSQVDIFPNPTSGVFTLTYLNPSTQQVEIGIYSSSGALVETVFDGSVPPGRHSVEVDGSALPEGMYFCRLRTESGIGYGKFVKAER